MRVKEETKNKPFSSDKCRNVTWFDIYSSKVYNQMKRKEKRKIS